MTESTSALDIRSAAPGDEPIIKQIAVKAGLFGEDDVGIFDEMLGGFFAGELEGHRWLVAELPNSGISAAAYFAPEPFADRMWNLYFIAVDPTAQGEGLGSELLRYVESQLRDAGQAKARTLIVETSSTDQFVNTRNFYERHGFVEEARIRQFYGPTDDKVVFWKLLQS